MPAYPRPALSLAASSVRFCATTPTDSFGSDAAVRGPNSSGIADDGECPSHEQAAQIAIALLADTTEPVLAPLECCFGTSPIQAEKLRPDRKASLVQQKAPVPARRDSRAPMSV
jgi:hypothetical protein